MRKSIVQWTAIFVLGVIGTKQLGAWHNSQNHPMFTIHTPAFVEGSTIPVVYTCEGKDRSPELVWSGAPAGTQSYVLICDDPDAPVGVWTHWVVYDIPGTLTGLEAGATLGADTMKEGMGSSGEHLYRGPCPPHGHGVHRYFFRLYAMDLHTLGLPEAAARKAVEAAMKGHVLGETACMGRFERK